MIRTAILSEYEVRVHHAAVGGGTNTNTCPFRLRFKFCRYPSCLCLSVLLFSLLHTLYGTCSVFHMHAHGGPGLELLWDTWKSASVRAVLVFYERAVLGVSLVLTDASCP